MTPFGLRGRAGGGVEWRSARRRWRPATRLPGSRGRVPKQEMSWSTAVRPEHSGRLAWGAAGEWAWAGASGRPPRCRPHCSPSLSSVRPAEARFRRGLHQGHAQVASRLPGCARPLPRSPGSVQDAPGVRAAAKEAAAARTEAQLLLGESVCAAAALAGSRENVSEWVHGGEARRGPSDHGARAPQLARHGGGCARRLY